jgi:hypothetical protein
MRRPSSAIALLIFLLIPLSLRGQDPFVGTFQGDGLTLVLQSTGEGEYRGEAEEDGVRFSVQARSSGSMLEGSYSFFGMRSPFRATLEGPHRMVVEADGERYTLLRAGGRGETEGGGGAATGGGSAAAATTTATTATSAVDTPQGPPASNEIDDPRWGLRFRIPPGWELGQQEEGSWVLVSATVPGALVVSELEVHSLDELRRVVAGEIVDQGIRLTPGGGSEPVGSAGLGVEVTGTLGDAPVQGYAVGVVSPHGPGLTILAVTEPGRYEPAHREAARLLGESVVFRAPAVAGGALGEPVGENGWWHAQLAGQRLVRLGRSGTTGGGSQNRTTVTLCRDGRGGYLYTYSMAMDVGGVFGNSSQRDEGEGRWEVVVRGGQPLLVMRFHDGTVYEWTLSMENDRIHLDGRQYLRDGHSC